jgi:hypothetical protein
VSALLADPHRMQAMSDASIPRAAAFTTASTAGLYVRRFEELRAGRQAASAAVTPG